MTPEQKTIVEQLKAAKHPEDLFGKVDRFEEVEKLFKKYAVLVHPDKLNSDSAPFQALSDLRNFAEVKLASGTYGDRAVLKKPIVVAIHKEVYTLDRKPPGSEIANFYTGTNKAGEPIVLKVAKQPRDNELLINEVKNLKAIREDPKNKNSVNTLKLIPKVLNSFVNVSGKVNQHAVVFAEFPKNGYPLKLVREKWYPKGIPLHHAAWILNRVMGALENAHEIGICHGAILPENLIIYPETHGAMLLNWDFSLPVGEKLKGVMGGPLKRICYPSEVTQKLEVDTGLDLFMLAKLFIYMVGGNINCNDFPDWIALLGPDWNKDKTAVFKKIEGMMRACMLSKTNRTTSLKSLFQDFRAALEAIYGPPKFREMQIQS